MPTKIMFSGHAQRKLKERRLDEAIVKKVLENADFIFYDLISKTMIAIGGLMIGGISTNLVIPYLKEDDALKVVTVYPCKYVNREIRKKEGIRWVRIK